MAWVRAAVFGPLAATVLCACAVTSTSMGRRFSMAHVADIRPCVTTERDLLTWFGEPFGWSSANGLLTLQWVYMRLKMRMGSESPSDSQSLVVVLNREGKVVQFAINPVCPATEARDVCTSTRDASAQ
jgi:hypothetical protein